MPNCLAMARNQIDISQEINILVPRKAINGIGKHVAEPEVELAKLLGAGPVFHNQSQGVTLVFVVQRQLVIFERCHIQGRVWRLLPEFNQRDVNGVHAGAAVHPENSKLQHIDNTEVKTQGYGKKKNKEYVE